jgi:DNA-binding MarR family transcriptional regulator
MNQQAGIFGIFVILFLIKIEEMIDNQREMIEVLKMKQSSNSKNLIKM